MLNYLNYMGWFFHHKKYKMENKYTDYLRLKRDYNYDILRSICVNPTSKLIYFKPGKSAGTSIFRRNLQPKGGWIIQKDNPKEFNNWLQNITDKDDWKTLCNLTNLPYQELGHYANRNHNHYTTYYTDEIREIVSNWYRRDLEFFNYNFK